MRSQAAKHTAFWVAILLIVAVSALVYINTQRLIQTAGTVDRTQIVLFNLEQLLSLLKDAETGQRGYLLTGDEQHLEPYATALAVLPDQLAHLRELTVDNIDQLNRVDRVETLAKQRLTTLKAGMDASKQNGINQALSTIMSSGKVVMDQIRDLVGDMVQHEGQRYAIRRQSVERQALHANIFFILGIITSLLIISALFIMMRREIRWREQAEGALHGLNASLEQLVSDRTTQLQEEAEERRRRSEELQAVFDEAALGIVGLTPDCRVMLWNRAAERIFGYEATEVLDQAYPIVHPEAKAEFDQIIARAAAGERLQGLAVRRHRKDGKLIDILVSGAPLYAADGKLRGFVFVFEDVTERRSIQRQLVQAQKMEAVGQLSGGIAHDFNNLLAIAIGSLDLLQLQLQEGDTAGVRELVDSALKANLRGAELTKQLLAFSRKQTLVPRPIDINALVGNMTALLRRTLGEDIQISLRKAEDLWLALADPTQVESALTNLAINARDAMSGGGRLTIETRNAYLDEQYAAQNPEVKSGDYAMLAVSDTGVGIPPDVIDRVFDPFFTTKGEGKGTGLGLSMVYGFARQSAGHVKIYSEVGHGTTVRLYLPRTKADTEREQDAASQPVVMAGDRILVVEDNAGVRAMVLKQLRSLGYRVMEADSGAAATQILRSAEPVDLLFTDVVMPGQTGFELAVEAKRLRPNLKVLLTSGFTEEALHAGNDAQEIPLLSKPYQRYELARKIEEVLRRNGQGGE